MPNNASAAQRSGGAQSHNALGLLALAAGAFVLGAAEFVMMGILPQAAQTMHVSIPFAGNFISAYAIGVCVGTLILVFGRRIPPRTLIVIFMIIAFAGNALSAAAVNAEKAVEEKKAEAEKAAAEAAKKAMVTGQTVANMLGVPAGTLLAEHMTWRLAFCLLAAIAALTALLARLWIPYIQPVEDAGLRGQFRFLRKPGPWMVLIAVFVGNTGIFCWWSYVSPWLQKVGGWPSNMVSLMMMLAGFGMVVGGLCGGRIADHWHPGATSAVGQAVADIGLVSAPQQLLMAEAGKGGGELIGGATVQIAFNFGNAVGSFVGGAVLNATAMNYHYPALSGVPFAAVAVLLLVLYAFRYERGLLQ